MASMADELVPPTSMSTPCWSNHSRALLAATSALFWWSANTNSIFLPLTVPPKSAIAILMASAPAGPSMSAYTPDMSVTKPIFTTSLLNWAFASVKGAQPRATADASASARYWSFMAASRTFLPWKMTLAFARAQGRKNLSTRSRRPDASSACARSIRNAPARRLLPALPVNSSAFRETAARSLGLRRGTPLARGRPSVHRHQTKESRP